MVWSLHCHGASRPLGQGRNCHQEGRPRGFLSGPWSLPLGVSMEVTVAGTEGRSWGDDRVRQQE